MEPLAAAEMAEWNPLLCFRCSLAPLSSIVRKITLQSLLLQGWGVMALCNLVPSVTNVFGTVTGIKLLLKPNIYSGVN